MYGKFAPIMKMALSALVFAGIQSASHAQCAAYSSTWAGGTSATPQMVTGVQAVIESDGTATGVFNVVTAAYVAHGNCTTGSITYDAKGSHATVFATVTFNQKTKATATIVMNMNADGTYSEGVEVQDATTHAVLATTGHDATGALKLLPVVKGSIFISNPVGAPPAGTTTPGN